MKVSNKKIVVVVLLIIELTSCYLMYQSSKKEVNLDKVSYQENIPNNLFAMYIKNEETGEYDEVTDTNIFPDGYKLNSTKTGCIDNKGNLVENILNYKNGKVAVKSNKTVFCYLYFDIDNSVYQKVRSDYKNSNGALLLSETESDEYPVYYYSGNITNNNILYANFCWKMVRTTEKGGVKLIYNGVPDTTEDGTLTCDNTGDESQIGTSAFNSSNNSPAYVGYMYNSKYAISSKAFNIYTAVLNNVWLASDTSYIFGPAVTWDGSKYILSNSDGSELKTFIWSESYNELGGYYTCRSITDTSCETVYYIVGGNASYMYYYGLSDNKTKDDYKKKLAKEITDNGDGTYTLVESIEVSKADWYANYINSNYYYCSDYISETCEDMRYFTKFAQSTYNIGSLGINVADIYKYGNSFEYKDGVYTLKDTKEFWDWSTNYNQINNNHYTCFNASGECENIYYIYQTNNSTAYYITLKDGKSVEDAINEMLYAEDVNTIDSTVKAYIDEWYENSILDKLDSNSNLYSSYLENTIWCNNREIKDLAGWNPNGGSTSTNLMFNLYSLECENQTDQFTLKVESGGTEGYGNNALDYPIGMLTKKEEQLASIRGFLNINKSYWLLTPGGFWASGAFGGNNTEIYTKLSNRPAISLSNKVEISSGNGEVDNPYQVVLSS